LSGSNGEAKPRSGSLGGAGDAVRDCAGVRGWFRFGTGFRVGLSERGGVETGGRFVDAHCCVSGVDVFALAGGGVQLVIG